MAKLADAMPEGGIIISFTQMLPKTMVNHQQPDQLLKPEHSSTMFAEGIRWWIGRRRLGSCGHPRTRGACSLHVHATAQQLLLSAQNLHEFRYVPAASKPDEAAKEEATPEAAPEALGNAGSREIVGLLPMGFPPFGNVIINCKFLDFCVLLHFCSVICKNGSCSLGLSDVHWLEKLATSAESVVALHAGHRWPGSYRELMRTILHVLSRADMGS
eukprot:5952206-Amphidinium_carterae.1